MEPLVIKLGGAALSHPSAAKNLAEAIMLLKERGEKVVVVHGGGPTINQRLTVSGISWTFHEGQRVTTPEMMAVIEDALSEVNQHICQVFKQSQLPAIGIMGNVGQMFLCSPMKLELGLVGQVESVNTSMVLEALEAGLIPVIGPIGIGSSGESYNLNADWGASALASALGAKSLIYATDQRGILDLNGLPYDALTLGDLRVLMKKGGVKGGMLAKSRSIEGALLAGVRKVCVTHALELKELIENKTGGTLCVELSRLEHALKMKGAQYVAT